MIIECFGIPGAGKSTLSSLLEEHYSVKTIPKQVSKKYSLRFILRHPIFFFYWCQLLVRECYVTKTAHLFRFKFAVFITTIGRIYCAQVLSKSNKIVILDEGFIQRVFSLYESKQKSVVYKSVFNRLPINHTVIKVEYIGDAFNVGRVGTWRTRLGEEYKKKWQNVMQHNYKSMSEALEDCTVTVFTYARDETDADFEQFTSQILPDAL